MRVLFILNRASGGYNEAFIEKCMKTLRRGSVGVEALSPESPEGLRRSLRSAIGLYDVLIIGGGDGTVGLAADTLRGEDQPIAILPLGRGNTFYRSIYGDAEPCTMLLEALAAGLVRRIDVGYVVELDRVFVLGASLGFIAEVLRTARRYTFLGGRLAYALTAVNRILSGVASRECDLEVEGRRVYTGEAALLSAGMTMYRAGRFKLFPEASLDDGLIDYLAVPSLSRFSALRFLGATLRGRHIGLGGVVYGKSSRVKLACSRAPAEIDGDIVEGVEELTIEVWPGRLGILLPQRQGLRPV